MIDRFHRLSLVSGSINEFLFWEAIFLGSQKRLMRGIFSSERVDGNQSRIQIDLGSNQSMRPVLIHKQAMAQNAYPALLACAAQKDDTAVRMSLKIESPRSGKRPACGCPLYAAAQMTAVGRNVSSRLNLQGSQRLVMKSLPDFCLLAGIEALDGSLKAGFPWRRKDWGHPQAQTKPGDPPDGIWKMVGSLKAGVVVELHTNRKAKYSPMLSEGVNDFGSRYAGIWPRGYQAAMERDTVEDIHMGAAFDHQVFDHIEAVKFAVSLGHISQVPAGRRRLMTNPASAIKNSPALQDPPNSASGGRVRHATTKQLSMNCRSAIFTQVAHLFKLAANHQHKVLGSPIGMLNSMRYRRPVIPHHLIERLIPGSPYPIMNSSEPEMVEPCCFTHRGPLTDSNHHSLLPFDQRAFLATFNLPGVSFCNTVNNTFLTVKCSGGYGN